MNNVQKTRYLIAQQKPITTYEGGVAYEVPFKEKLAEFFSLGLLNGNFYQTQEEVLYHAKEILEKALKECPEFATKCAIYGNEVNSLKLVPTIWLVYLSTLEDKTLFQKAFPRIIRNPKMAYDFMEIARKGGIRQGLGRGVKKVMNQWLLDRLNEYQVSRNRGKLLDIIRLTRPSFRDETFQGYMRYLSKGELTFERAKVLKEVIHSIENGTVDEFVLTSIEKHRFQLEELKHVVHRLSKEDKQKVYEQIYKEMNYAALLLNLVALERVFALETKTTIKRIPKNGFIHRIKQQVVVETDIPTRIIEMISQRIQDVEAYRKANILPFALMNAEKMVVTPEWKQAIGSMLRKVAEETFRIHPEVSIMVAVDTSASMFSEITDTGSLRCVEVASLFGALMKKSHAKTNLYAVATTMRRVLAHKQDDVLEISRKIRGTYVGHGTRFEQIMDHYQGEKYVILITDSEQADNLEKRWRMASKPQGAKLIVWQLQPYYIRISNDPSVVYVRGYSDRLLSLIRNIIEEKGNQIEEIEKILL